MTDPRERPLFTFVQINDTHVQGAAGKASDVPRLPRAEEKLAAVVRLINEETLFPLPDFVIGLGDLINGMRANLLEPDMAAFQGLIAPLKAPFLPAVGNHENIQREGDADLEAAYDRAFGKGTKQYCFTCGGVLFIVLNNAGALGGGDAVSDARNRWLGRVMDAHPDAPKIVLCHVPLVPLRDPAVLRESFGFPTFVTRGSGTLDLVEAQADTVIAVLSGHLHLTAAAERNGIHHVCPSGPSSYPSHFARYAVHADRVEVVMHQPPADLVGRREDNNLHGTPRWDREHTDADHPTPESYVAGAPAEQRLTIPLPPAKRPRPDLLGAELQVLGP